ncbi:MAG: hypothetical protein R2911_20300 [Caldilineaceae bacterium]
MYDQFSNQPALRHILLICLFTCFLLSITHPQTAQATARQQTIPGQEAGHFYLPISARDSGSAPIVQGNAPNPCAEGEFLDLRANLCRKLDRPDLGFDYARFEGWWDKSRVIQSACDEAAFESALAAAQGGGTVRLPACTMEVGRIDIPSQVVIEGAGVGQTILRGGGCVNAAPKRILLVQNQADVVIRNLSMDAGGANCVMLEVERSTNVLIERIEIYNSTEVGMRFKNGVRNITIRYADIYGNGEFHGIGSKECATGATVVNCPPESWSSSYAIYSNRLHNHDDHGFNLHGLNGEVAGNLSYYNHHAGKFFDAQCVWVHHNYFRSVQDWAVFVAPTLNIPERASHDLYFYKNQYVGTPADTFSWGITYTGDNVTLPPERYINIYAMDNEYAGRLKSHDIQLNICPNTAEESSPIDNKQFGAPNICALSTYPSLGGSAQITPLVACPTVLQRSAR